MRLCSNVPGQSIVQTALGGYQSMNELLKPGGRIFQQREYITKAINEIPRRQRRPSGRRLLHLPEARPGGLSDRQRRAVCPRPAPREEGPRHAGQRLPLGQARPFPHRVPPPRGDPRRSGGQDRGVPPGDPPLSADAARNTPTYTEKPGRTTKVRPGFLPLRTGGVR